MDLVPAFTRHVKTYLDPDDTDSKFAGYLADAVDALSYFWIRDYAVTVTTPNTYTVTPEIERRDFRPIILMASIIYKMGNINIAGFSDGDFSYNPFPRGKDTSTLSIDVNELALYGIRQARLAAPSSMPMRGFNNVYNAESYIWPSLFSLFGY